jgi:NADPH:quinone reductase-like Zn-dependent oxidoreductase
VSKAFRFHEHGGPEVLRFEDVEVGAPGPGQVRIRNVAVAVNYRDVLMRLGVHAVKSLPSGIGLESAGVIDAACQLATASPVPACRKALMPKSVSSRRRASSPCPPASTSARPRR